MTRKFLSLVLVAILVPMLWGCPKKVVDDIKADLLVDLITNNIWVMNTFSEGATDLSAEFSPYSFKFNRDGSVYGTKPATADAVGTWAGNAATTSIVAAFPNETTVLKKLTGTWIVTNTTTSYVKAHRFEGSTELKLYLVKK